MPDIGAELVAAVSLYYTHARYAHSSSVGRGIQVFAEKEECTGGARGSPTEGTVIHLTLVDLYLRRAEYHFHI
jgi:hypothetical protein